MGIINQAQSAYRLPQKIDPALPHAKPMGAEKAAKRKAHQNVHLNLGKFLHPTKGKKK